MRVLLDATPLLLPGGGVKSYVYSLLLHLRRIGGGRAEVRAFPFVRECRKLAHEGSVFRPASTYARLGLVCLANGLRLPLMDLLGRDFDLFHETNTHVLYPPSNTRLTATIHDMTCWLMPQVHQRANVIATKRFFKRMRLRVDRWIAVSARTRDDAAEAAGIPIERIEVIHPGVPDAFFKVVPGSVAAVRRKYGLFKPYVLNVGVLEPRKNVGALLTAYKHLPDQIRRDFDLVIAGPIGWGGHPELKRIHEGIAGVRYIGYVPEASLPALTSGATIFAYPSLYEGFGLPVAQAMAAGVPVVTSNTSALPETTGGAALAADPTNPDELAWALERLLSSDSLRKELAESGFRRAAEEYRWQKSAAKTLDFFARVCNG